MKSTSQNAVSPVIAVILMVAVTVILSAVVGAFVFNMGDSIDDSKSNQNMGVRLTNTPVGVEITVVTGESDSLEVLVDGEIADRINNPEPGKSTTVVAAEKQSVTVVSMSDGKQDVVSSTTVTSSPTFQEGLVAHYRFESGSGDETYDTAGDHTGVHNGTWNMSSKIGEYALHFDGKNQTVDSTGIRFKTTENRTYAVWLYYSGTGSSANYPRIMSFNTSTTDGAGLEFAVRVPEQNLSVYDGASWYDTQIPVPNKTWIHAAIVYDGSNITVYKNGSPMFTNSSSGRENAGAVALGNRQGHNDEGIGGLLDDARIYNRALSSSEVQDLYNATK